MTSSHSLFTNGSFSNSSKISAQIDLECKKHRVDSTANCADFILIFIQEYYFRNENRVSPGLLWLELCRLYYRIRTSKAANHLFQNSDLNDLKLISKFLILAKESSISLRLSAENHLFPVITTIMNNALQTDFTKYSSKFINMLERFLCIHPAYAKALSPTIFIKLNLIPNMYDLNSDEWCNRIIDFLKSTMGDKKNFESRSDIFNSLLPVIKTYQASTCLSIFLEYYKSFDKIYFIVTDEITNIKRFFLTIEPDQQKLFVKQLIEDIVQDKKPPEKKLDITKVLLEFLPDVSAELQDSIWLFIIDKINYYHATRDCIHQWLTKNINVVPQHKIDYLVDKLLSLLRGRCISSAYLLGKIANRLTASEVETIIATITNHHPHGGTNNAEIVALSELLPQISNTNQQKAVGDFVMRFLKESSYLLGNYKRWDHLTLFVTPRSMLITDDISEVHGATLVALNRLAIFVTEQDKETVSATLISELEEEYFPLRNNAYTFMGGLHHFIPNNQKLTLLNLLLDHPHKFRSMTEDGCEVIGLSVCQLISGMDAPLEVNDILEKLINSKCMSLSCRTRDEYNKELSLFFAAAFDDLKDRFQQIWKIQPTYIKSIDEEIETVIASTVENKPKMLTNWLLLAKEKLINIYDILTLMLKNKKHLHGSCDGIIADYIVSVIEEDNEIPKALCCETIKTFIHSATCLPSIKKFLLKTFILESSSTIHKVRALLALSHLIVTLDDSEKITICNQLKHINLWFKCDIDPAQYSNPGLFFELGNFQLTKELVTAFIEHLNNDTPKLTRIVILNNILYLIERLPDNIANYFVYGLLPLQYALAQHDLVRIELSHLINTFRANTYKDLLVGHHLNQELNITKIVTEYSQYKYSAR
jgi:hypothetical protein